MYICLYMREIFLLHYCSEIDECATGSHNCNSNEYCVNKPGGFICKCISGFKSVDGTCKGIMYISCI